jgi:hypothetical protein
VLLLRALKDKFQGIGALNADIAPGAMSHLIGLSHNVPHRLNTLEIAAQKPHRCRRQAQDYARIIEDTLKNGQYDKRRQITTSLRPINPRDSNPDGALYWLAMMLKAAKTPVHCPPHDTLRLGRHRHGRPRALVAWPPNRLSTSSACRRPLALAKRRSTSYRAQGNSLYEAYAACKSD